MTQPIVIMCQPLYGHVPLQAHGESMTFLGANIAKNCIHGYLARMRAYIDEARNALITNVLEGFPTATHIFFNDQDTVCPHETVEMLLSHDKEVVSGVYFGKDSEATLVAFGSIDPPSRLADFDPTCVQAVAGVGMGCCLIRTQFIKDMAKKYGDEEWFRSERSGEDYHFCKRAKEMGVKVWLDGRVQCMHLMDGVVTYDTWKAARAKRDAKAVKASAEFKPTSRHNLAGAMQ